jgi:glycosyltransferase involved in cell wall biosynthesis
MRIAMVAACPFPSYQGSQVFVHEMSEALSRRGHEVVVLTYGQQCRALAESESTYEHRRIGRLPWDDASRSGPTLVKPLLDFRLASALRSAIRSEGFDVVHCHNYEAAAVGAVVRSIERTPTVYHSHGSLEIELPTYFEGAVARRAGAVAGASFDRWIPRAVDHTVVLREADAVQLRRRSGAGVCVSVVPPAVSDPGPPEDPVAARSALGLPADRFVIGYAGNLDAYQDLDALARSVALFRSRRGMQLPLWLVVTHAPTPSFARAIERLGLADVTQVLEVNAFSAVRRAMAASDVLVLPRRSASGFPIKLLNYMAAGKPIVAGAGTTGLFEDGEEGLLVADREGAMVDALVRVASEPPLAARLGRAARQRFTTEYTWDAVVPAIERVYVDAAGARRAAQTARSMLR